MKGDPILFEVAGDSLRDLTFKGYWHCDRKLEQTLLGPSTAYKIIGDKVDGDYRAGKWGCTLLFRSA